MQPILVVPGQMSAAMTAHAASCLPAEACGLIAVDASGRLRMFYALTNDELSPTSFTIAAADHYGAVRNAEARGWSIGGVMHSHPSGPAVPSARDLSQPHDPEWFHIIVGLRPAPHVRAWSIAGRESKELVVVEED